MATAEKTDEASVSVKLTKELKNEFKSHCAKIGVFMNDRIIVLIEGDVKGDKKK